MVEVMHKAVWVIVTTVLTAAITAAMAVHGQKVPCYFVFGDSLVDNGNNNNLKTKAKVNFAPYGIDFPNGPTGRFSNGRNIADLIGQLTGFREFIPPFAGASPEKAHTGINYASGGGGLRKESGKKLGTRIYLKKQIYNHNKAIKKAAVPRSQLQKCLYLINIGSNDYINNYFMPKLYNTSIHYTPKQYAKSLIKIYRSDLKRLYGLGARKVAMFGVGKIGCAPKTIRSHGGGKGCAVEMNDAAKFFNKNLKDLVADFNKRLVGAKFTFVDLFSNGDKKVYADLGFKVATKGCCTLKPGRELCVANKPVCKNRNEYIFWDDLHGTEAVNKVIAKAAFIGNISSPYNIAELVK